MVLLKNEDERKSTGLIAPTLPADPTGRVALIGPHAQTHLLLGGNYFEDICPDPDNLCVPSMEDAIGGVAGEGRLTVVPGCDSTECGALGPAALARVIAAVESADTVIVALGLMGKPQIYDAATPREVDLNCSLGGDGTEGEGHDRYCIGLPIGQLKLLDAVLFGLAARLGIAPKATIVLFNGGGLAIEGLMAKPGVGAVVEAFYPGVAGATAIAETLFGQSNRWGKLPYTLFAESFTAESEFLDMNMTDSPGRTYKYYTGPSTIRPFGFGLSYTTFDLGPPSLRPAAVLGSKAVVPSVLSSDAPAATSAALDATLVGTSPTRAARVLRGDADYVATASINVTNTGKLAGDEVVFLYHNGTAAARLWASREGTDGPDPLAIKLLVGFRRVQLAPGESTTVEFDVTLRSLATVDKHGVRHTLAGDHGLIFSRGHGVERHATIALKGHGRVVLSVLSGAAGSQGKDTNLSQD